MVLEDAVEWGHSIDEFVEIKLCENICAGTPLCFESSWSAFTQILAETPELTPTGVAWLFSLLSTRSSTALLYALTPSDSPIGGVPSQAGLRVLRHEVTLQHRQSNIRPNGKLYGTASIQQ